MTHKDKTWNYPSNLHPGVSTPANRIANDKWCLKPPRDYVVPISPPPNGQCYFVCLPIYPIVHFLCWAKGSMPSKQKACSSRKSIPAYKIRSIIWANKKVIRVCVNSNTAQWYTAQWYIEWSIIDEYSYNKRKWFMHWRFPFHLKVTQIHTLNCTSGKLSMHTTHLTIQCDKAI